MRRTRALILILLLGGGLAMTPADAQVATEAGRPHLQNVAELAAGAFHTCALRHDGQVRCWGRNSHGQLGNGTRARSTHAVVVRNSGGIQPLQGVVQIAAGVEHTCAVLESGQVRCWGYGHFGALGVGDDASDALRPRAVLNESGSGPLTGVIQVTAGDSNTCALLSNHQVRCWGFAYSGQAGNDVLYGEEVRLPSVVLNEAGDGPLRNVTSISTHGIHVCARMASSEVRCWGNGFNYGLGNDSNDDHARPVAVRSRSGPGRLADVRRVDPSGSEFTCALLQNGEARCWGTSSTRALGDGTDEWQRRRPTIVVDSTTNRLRGVTQLSVGGSFACVRLANGRAKCWGSLRGDGIGNASSRPRTVENPNGTAPIAGVQRVSGGGSHACLVVAQGEVRCFGDNQYGQLGNGSQTSSLLPTVVLA